MCVCVFAKETAIESGSGQSAQCVLVLSAVNVLQIVLLMAILRRVLY